MFLGTSAWSSSSPVPYATPHTPTTATPARTSLERPPFFLALPAFACLPLPLLGAAGAGSGVACGTPLTTVLPASCCSPPPAPGAPGAARVSGAVHGGAHAVRREGRGAGAQAEGRVCEGLHRRARRAYQARRERQERREYRGQRAYRTGGVPPGPAAGPGPGPDPVPVGRAVPARFRGRREHRAPEARASRRLAGPVVGPLGSAARPGHRSGPPRGRAAEGPRRACPWGRPHRGTASHPSNPARIRRRTARCPSTSVYARARARLGRARLGEVGRSPRSPPNHPYRRAARTARATGGRGRRRGTGEAPDPLLGGLRGANQSLVRW